MFIFCYIQRHYHEVENRVEDLEIYF
jgi:hypothetical protein